MNPSLPALSRLFLPLALLSIALPSSWGQELPTATSSLFAGSGTCVPCHRSDGQALTDSQGNPVDPPTDWRSTLLANALHDPFFQANVESETAEFPELKSLIEDKCLQCHAPMARTQAVHDGATSYSLAEALASPLAGDGVSCTLCHQIQPTNLGTFDSFSGNYLITDDRIIFGPYMNPHDSLMQGTVNYDAQFGAHKQTSEVCATCHTLFTPTLDSSGAIVGSFPEQVPYLEWKNSVYSSGSEAKVCQDCHMPRIEESIVISVVPNRLPERSPFWKHHFAGGNAFMLSIFRDNAEALNLAASPDQFERTRQRTLNQLASAADLDLIETDSADGVTTLVVSVANRSGHKIPTGFPSRRFWLHVRITDSLDQVVFDSGNWDENGEIIGLDPGYERHHDRITDPGQVQVYESVMGNVSGEQTYILLYAAQYLKDNRIPPRGFRFSGDTEYTAPRGTVVADANFNRAGSAEGTGSDLVTYGIPTSSAAAPLTVHVELLYQSLAPRFVEELFEGSGSHIEAFEELYQDADNTPTVVASLTRTLEDSGPSLWVLY